MPVFRCVCTVHLELGRVLTTTQEVIGVEARHEGYAAELAAKAAKKKYKDWKSKVTKVTIDSITRR